MRQPILYAYEMWRRQRLWVVFLLVVGVGATVATLVSPQLRASSNLNWIFFAYIPAGLLLGAGLLYYRWRSQVEVTDAWARRVFQWNGTRWVEHESTAMSSAQIDAR